MKTNTKKTTKEKEPANNTKNQELRRWLYGIWNDFENRTESPDKRVGSNEFFATWFIRRFCKTGYKPTDDYAQEWVARFKTGTPWFSMDGEGLQHFQDLINGDREGWFGHDACKCGHNKRDHIAGHDCEVKGCKCQEYKGDTERRGEQ